MGNDGSAGSDGSVTSDGGPPVPEPSVLAAPAAPTALLVNARPTSSVCSRFPAATAPKRAVPRWAAAQAPSACREPTSAPPAAVERGLPHGGRVHVRSRLHRSGRRSICIPPISFPDGGITLPDGGFMFPDGGFVLPDGGFSFPDGGFPGL